ncbi:WXG100 family type VII secretion target [Nocardia asteroides]|uniref:WXG100 family type VII secretion target n=1 Tax=Nocardia asteroides TaxID=1824 RepID=UPI001E31A918|nr:WXG100 family type VII secretion target [Nocardia asteroides]UGT59409.1 WXG100 family type VII secretion target [Nocardia asteroides]
MAGGYSVDPEQLRNLTAKLHGYQDFLSGHLAELEQRVQGLSAGWSGVAADAYTEAHHDWATALDDIRDGLSALEQTAARAAESYTTAVATNLKMVGRKR